MRFVLLAAVVFLLPLSAQAAEHRLAAADIQAWLADHTFSGVSDTRKIEQVFQAAGVTYYTVDGAMQQGFWKVDGDHYCSQWPPSEHWSCYDVMVDGPGTVFVSSSGTRYAYVRQP